MKLPDLKDFTIRYKGHPKYDETKIEENNPIEVLVQKLEMLLLTNKGEVVGNPDFGADLEYKLWKTNMSKETIEDDVNREIGKYIPQLADIGYTLDVSLFEGKIRDILYLNFTIKGYNFIYMWQ